MTRRSDHDSNVRRELHAIFPPQDISGSLGRYRQSSRFVPQRDDSSFCRPPGDHSSRLALVRWSRRDSEFGGLYSIWGEYNAQVDDAATDKHEGNRTHTHSNPDTGVPYKGFNVNVPQGPRGFVAMGNDTQHHIGPTGPADNLPAVTRVFFIEKIN